MDKKLFKSIAALLLLFVVVVAAVLNLDVLLKFFFSLVSAFMPLIVGFLMAFILNKPFKIIYDLLAPAFGDKRLAKGRKPIALLLTYLLFIGIIALFMGLLIPQLVESFSQLASNLEQYIATMQKYLNWLTDFLNLKPVVLELASVRKLLEDAFSGENASIISGIVPQIFDWTQGFVRTVSTSFIATILSVYILADKDRLKRQTSQILYAFLPRKVADKVVYITDLTNHTFSNYLNGQLLDAVILGAICFVTMSVFGFEYAALISIIIGFTNMIPIVGPFIGTVPGFLITLMAGPMRALAFVALVIVLQQVESNLIYPRIMGDQIGLPAIWVLVSIVVSGSLFGIVGMIFAVPTTSVLYSLTKETAVGRLDERRIELDTNGNAKKGPPTSHP